MKAKITSDSRFLQIYDYTQDEIDQVHHSMKKRINSWRWHPLVKKGMWDGFISYIDKFHRIPVGLWHELKEISEKFDFDLTIDEFGKIYDYDFDQDHFENWVNEFFKGAKKVPRDYQISSAISILKYRRSTSEIATSAGKTLILFMIFAYLKTVGKMNRMLMIVPNTNLILQTLDDFAEYSNGKFDFTVQKIYGGTSKEVEDVDFVIGTFQSLVKLDADWFDDIDVIAVDEAHYTHAKSIKEIIASITGLVYAFGVSGTLKAAKGTADSFTIQAYLGPKINDISAKFLIQNNYASGVNIKVIKMDYLDADIKEQLFDLRSHKTANDGAKHLNHERHVVIDNRKRHNFIMNMLGQTTKNTLVLFADIKRGFGKKMYDWLRDNTQKQVYYIDGSTPIQRRQEYFEGMEKTTLVDKIQLTFGSHVVSVFPHESIPLSNGSSKHAREITTLDDVKDDWILKKSKK